MRSLDQLDFWISAKVKAWSSRVSGAPKSSELLEIRRDILADIRDHIQPKGGGQFLFPYNAISICIGTGDSDRKSLFEASFEQSDELEQTVRALLAEAACPIPTGFHVSVSAVEDADSPFRIDYASLKDNSAPKIRNARPNAKLKILRGQAEAGEYAIHSDRVNIGRMKEVAGEKGGLRRRNEIAFADTETTVSREHAYVRYDVETGKFRLYDSGSQRGTFVFRDGRRLDVPKDATHGLQLRPGDEIYLGDARIVFEADDV
ncbi:MAG: FHA domain-containing protein [Bryobacteraceae bacterium]